MHNDFRQKIIDDFGLSKLPQESQEHMIERIGTMLFETVIERSIDEMDGKTSADFDSFLNTVGQDYSKVIAFLQERIPGFQGIVSDEMARLKRATAGIFA